MYADIPWLNGFFGETFGNPDDASPLSFMVFYVNMNIASMYFMACLTILLLVVLTVVIGKKLDK